MQLENVHCFLRMALNSVQSFVVVVVVKQSITRFILKKLRDPQQLGAFPLLFLLEPTAATSHGVPGPAVGSVVRAPCT